MTMERAAEQGMTASDGAGYERRWWALLVLSLSLVVIGMDNTILNVALPTLARDLQATGSDLQWMVNSYILVFAGLLLTMGALGDRFGRKRALNAGLLVFVAGSVASAFAGSPEILIASRAAMGVGAALIMPSTLSIITNAFPPKERGRAIGVWAGVAGLGIVVGPVIGGWLLEHFWWGSVFLVNVPVVAVALLAGWPLVPESRDPRATPLDPVGAGLSIAALVALVYGIIEAPGEGWTDPLILASFGIAALLSAMFIRWELRVEHPMLRILPVAAMIVAAPLSARLVEAIGTKVVVSVGLMVVATGMWLLSTAEVATGYGLVAWSFAVTGTGFGLAMAPATESIMGSLPLAKAGVGSAMNDTTRQVGGALGVAVLGSVLASSYGSAIEPALRGVPPQVAEAAGDSIGVAATIAGQLGPQGQGLIEAARSAFIKGMGDAVLVGAAVAALATVLVFLFLPARGREEEPDGEPAAKVHTARSPEPTRP